MALMKSWGTRPYERYAALALTALVILGVHMLTLTISPTIWQDEVQIVDLGRQALHPMGRGWSLSWIAAGRPIAFINYLGPVLQELAYGFTAPSPSGPRVCTILGALLAAAFCYAWLRARGLPWRLAWVGGTLLLLDPQLVASYRGARVDVWVIALMFAACWVARRGSSLASVTPTPPRSSARLHFIAAGVLAGVAFFVWPSAFYLYALLGAEVVEAANGARTPLVRRLGLVVLGGLVSVITCLLPIAGRLASEWADIFVSKDAYLYQGSLLHRFLTGLAALPVASKLSPLLPLLAVLAVGFRRNRAIAVGAAATLLLMLPTQVYAGRVIYLLPYLVVLVIQAADALGARPPGASRWARDAALGLAFLWAAGLSLIGRPANAWAGRSARDPALLVAALAETGPTQHRRIYLGAWEFYYAGRAAGWEMFVPYGPFEPAALARFYGSLDAAIVRTDAGKSVTDALLASGMESAKELHVGPGTTIDNRSMRGNGYGSYVFYARRGAPAAPEAGSVP